MQYVLYDQNIRRVPLVGGIIHHRLARQAQHCARASMPPEPPLSIVIRTRNDGAHIQRLFESIAAQQYAGELEIIVVDTESTDTTVSYARSQGARIITIAQEDFTYPRALNLGFEAATHDWVVTLVGHSALTNTQMFRSLLPWTQQQSFGGMYGIPLANWNASIWERIGTILCVPFMKRAQRITTVRAGALGANCAIVRRSIWQALGGYDERYAGGGEDTALARAMVSRGYALVREPLCSVYHSHGLAFRHSWRQWMHWLEVSRAKPQPFDTQTVHARRPDLRDHS